MSRTFCAICIVALADTLDHIDGVTFAVCNGCKTELVPEPRETPKKKRTQMLRVLSRSFGLDIGEIAEALGCDDELGRARLSAALNRAIKNGFVMHSGGKMARTYWITDRGTKELRKAS